MLGELEHAEEAKELDLVDARHVRERVGQPREGHHGRVEDVPRVVQVQPRPDAFGDDHQGALGREDEQASPVDPLEDAAVALVVCLERGGGADQEDRADHDAPEGVRLGEALGVRPHLLVVPDRNDAPDRDGSGHLEHLVVAVGHARRHHTIHTIPKAPRTAPDLGDGIALHTELRCEALVHGAREAGARVPQPLEDGCLALGKHRALDPGLPLEVVGLLDGRKHSSGDDGDEQRQHHVGREDGVEEKEHARGARRRLRGDAPELRELPNIGLKPLEGIVRCVVGDVVAHVNSGVEFLAAVVRGLVQLGPTCEGGRPEQRKEAERNVSEVHRVVVPKERPPDDRKHEHEEHKQDHDGPYRLHAHGLREAVVSE